MRLCHFGAQNGLFASKTFLEKIINIIFIYLLVPLKKKILTADPDHFWAQNGPFAQMRIFSENLFMSLVSFIHAYLHAKNQSQILSY